VDTADFLGTNFEMPHCTSQACKKTLGFRLPSGDEYLFKAAAFFAKAESETDLDVRAGFANLARAYLRLAEQAIRNARTDVSYEPPPPKLRDPEIKR
jgi:hypothetical protein